MKKSVCSSLKFLKGSHPLFVSDSMSLIELLKSRKLLPLGSRRISKLDNDRYVVYLPIELNDLWKELNETKVKVRVYIEIEG